MISVIVPVFNGEKYINKCIDSILGQTIKELEIIFVNDGSTDKSAAILDEYSKYNSNIHVIHQENQGVSIARNIALDNANGDYIAFCDVDDYIAPNMLEILVSAMEQNDADISVCGVKEFSCDEDVFFKSDLQIEYEVLSDDEVFKNIIDNRNCSGYVWNKLFKSELINEKHLRFDETIAIGEDELFVVQYLDKRYKMVFVAEALYGYRNNPKGACQQPISEKKLSFIDARLKIFNEVENKFCGDEVKSIAWNRLIYACVYYFYKLCYLEKKQKRYYYKKICAIVRNTYQKYRFDARWSRKMQIAYFVLLLLSSRVFNKTRGCDVN